MILTAAWVGAYLGLFVLAYAAQVLARGDDPDTHRVLMRHATRLAHLPEEQRACAAHRIIVGTQVVTAASLAAITLGVVALVWASA